jgi:hypothetical protein
MKKNKDGVAIIVVLGLLAVMMLSAAAFSLSMRIEREGAFNMRHGLQAQHMIWAGLAAAMHELDGDLDGADGFTIYPDWPGGVMSSSQNTNDVQSGMARVVARQAMDYIPFSLESAVKNTQGYWHPIRDANNEMRGRFSYLIVNTSGLLDANRVGTNSVRGVGSDPEEIQLNEAELSDLRSLPDYILDRDRLIRYETFEEMNRLGNGLKTNEISNFFVHSLSPVREYLGAGYAGAPQVYIGGSPGGTEWNEAAIKQALLDSGVPAGKLDLAYLNIQDYIDADSVPQQLNKGCAEPVPMINEVSCGYQAQIAANGNINGMFGVQVEWFYPYAAPATNDTFNLHYEVIVTPDAANEEPALVPSTIARTETDITAGGMAGAYGTYLWMTNFGGSTVQSNIHVRFTVQVRGYIEGSGGRVDEVPSPYDTVGERITFATVDFPDVDPGGPQVQYDDWAECVDPRFNWNAQSTANQWLYGGTIRNPPLNALPSPGQINHTTRVFLDPASMGLPSPGYDTDGDTLSHVANRPLRTVGELGYILIGQWQTLRLYQHAKPDSDGRQLHKVLDYFTLYPASTNYVHGLVNLNSSNTNVLASLFYECPLEEYKTDGARIPWTAGPQQPDARAMATALIASSDQTFFRKLSEMGRRDAGLDWASFHPANTPEIIKEAPIRNSAGLLTVRDTTYTVLIAADSYSVGVGGIGGHTLASTRAVAEIWRDPFREANGHPRHKYLLRFLKILQD